MNALSRAVKSASRLCAPRRYAHDSYAALNIFKDPALAPAEKPDSDYPDWLWRLLDSKPTRQELLREAEGYFAVGGYDEVLDKMDEDRLRRLFRLDARERIREQNSFGGGF